MTCLAALNCIHRYIDHEAGPREQLDFEAHILECDACRAEYESIRYVVDQVRGARPVYPVSAALPAKVEALVVSRRTPRTFLHSALVNPRLAVGAGLFAAVAIAAIAFLPGLRTHHFTTFAADTHHRYAEGALPLGVTSSDPKVVSGWLSRHLPFPLDLPNFPLPAGEPKSYSLVGARFLPFEGKDIAYLAYRMNDRPISLLVGANLSSVVPDKYESWQSGKLVFHFSNVKGTKLISWKDHGLSYALVSDLEVGGAQSCIICHGSRSERRKFENLLRLTPPMR